MVKKYFNLQYASIGFLTMSVPVFIINLMGGTIVQAFIAGILQGLLSFFIIGFNTKIFEFLHDISNILAIIVPTLITTTLSLSIHLMNHSPQPILSASYVFIVALSNFILLTYFKKVHDTICIKSITKKVINYFFQDK